MILCKQCGITIPGSIKIDGKYKSLRSRRYCLICSPYKADNSTSLICKACGKSFDPRFVVDGKQISSYNRTCCLDCVPFGEKARQIFRQPLNQKRICSICNKEYVYERSKGHRSNRCNSCTTATRHIAKKLAAIEYKGGCCAVCGYNRYYGALKFHHAEPNEKEFNIGGNYTLCWETLKAELDKCVLLCGNCHDEHHAGLLGDLHDYLGVHSRKRESDSIN